MAPRLEVAYVDDAAPESGESDSDTIAGRRRAMIHWWLAGVADEVPGAVRPVHLIGDPARRLAQLSSNLDLACDRQAWSTLPAARPDAEHVDESDRDDALPAAHRSAQFRLASDPR